MKALKIFVFLFMVPLIIAQNHSLSSSLEPLDSSTAPSTPEKTTSHLPTESTSTSTEPTSPSTEPTTPSTEPTTPSTEPTTPSTEPTTPSTEPTTPSTEPTTPSTEPTTPSTEPTSPSTESTSTSTETPSTSTESTNTTTSENSTIVSSTTASPPTVETDFVLKNEKERVCFHATLTLSFKIPYSTFNNETLVKDLDPSSVTKSDRSSCLTKDNTTKLVLLVNEEDFLSFTFNKSENSEVYLLGVTFDYKETDFLNSTNNETMHHVESEDHEFKTPVDHSYLCKTKTSLSLLSSSDYKNVTLFLKDFQYMAFVNQSGSDFAPPIQCDQDTKVGDIVPIAVGVALAALVLIVLVAYVVGRRRSKQKGYTSV